MACSSDDPSAHRSVMAMVAPGTALRTGLERILAGRTGALIVIGVDPGEGSLCDGGFRLDVAFSPTRLRELAKMDGAVLLSADTSRILGANIQLMPDALLPTVESGTRHRTAERVALQTGQPVIAVSHSMNVISLYHHGHRHEVADSSTILARANQALATLHRYRNRLDEITQALVVAEIEDVVTLRDALTAIQRLLMVEQIADELTDDLIELGTDGRLVGLQLSEVLVGIDGLGPLLLRDYVAESAGGTLAVLGGDGVERRGVEVDELRTDGPDADGSDADGRSDGRSAGRSDGRELTDDVDAIWARLRTLRGTDLLNLPLLARELGYHSQTDPLDRSVSPRGHWLLSRVPRVPPTMLSRVADQFGSLQAVLAATASDLQAVEGIGETRARVIREGLSRLVETALSDRRPGRW